MKTSLMEKRVGIQFNVTWLYFLICPPNLIYLPFNLALVCFWRSWNMLFVLLCDNMFWQFSQLRQTYVHSLYEKIRLNLSLLLVNMHLEHLYICSFETAGFSGSNIYGIYVSCAGSFVALTCYDVGSLHFLELYKHMDLSRSIYLLYYWPPFPTKSKSRGHTLR